MDVPADCQRLSFSGAALQGVLHRWTAAAVFSRSPCQRSQCSTSVSGRRGRGAEVFTIGISERDESCGHNVGGCAENLGSSWQLGTAKQAGQDRSDAKPSRAARRRFWIVG